MHNTTRSPAQPCVVGQNIDTFIGNARVNGDFPEHLAAQLEDFKRHSQEAEEDLPTPWQFAGEVLFIKPHGAGRQWRWILHSPSPRVDLGVGKLTHIVVKARLSSAFLYGKVSTSAISTRRAQTARKAGTRDERLAERGSSRTLA